MMAFWWRSMAVVLALAFGEAIARGSPPVAEQSDAGHARARTAVEEVLSRAEFADLRRDAKAGQRRALRWLQSFWDSIERAIGRLPEWLLWVIVFWMFAALLAILAHLVYTLWKLLGGSGRASGAAASAQRRGGEILGIRDLDFDAVYAEARRLLGGGDWPAAIKYYYVAAILWLDRQGAIAFQPSKTNRDYFRELRARAGQQELFGRLTNCFEHVAYAGQAATASNSRAMAEAVEGMLHESE
jgi:hypothetical protein